MSKSAEKRRFRRVKYLVGLAETAPSEFHREWLKRLESWALLIRRRAHVLKDRKGDVPSAFSSIQEAIKELGLAGDEAVRQEAEITLRILEDVCSEAVAMAYDPRLRSHGHMAWFREKSQLYRPRRGGYGRRRSV